MPTTPTLYNAYRDSNLTYLSGPLYGFGDPGTIVQVWSDGKLLLTEKVKPQGLWATASNTPLPDGSYNLTAVSIDANGNVSASSPVHHLLVDNTAPAAPLITVDDAGAGNNPTKFSGRAEAGSKVELKIGLDIVATAVADGSGRWTASVKLADGDHTIVATAQDAARNVSAASTLEFNRTTSDDFGSDAANAGTLAIGGRARGAINFVGDVDWFKVSLEALTNYNFSIKAAKTGGGTLSITDDYWGDTLQLWDPQLDNGKGALNRPGFCRGSIV